MTHGNYQHSENSFSSGQSKAQEQAESMDLTCNEPLTNAARDVKPSPMEHSIQPSSDSRVKDGLIHTKVKHSEEEQNVNITSSQTLEETFSTLSRNSSSICNIGDLSDQTLINIIDEALEVSPIIRWFTYPACRALGPEERLWFSGMLYARKELTERTYYSSLYMVGWDLFQALHLCQLYVSSSVSQLINITIRLDK
nr:hypothetical protein [Adonisia turfae]